MITFVTGNTDHAPARYRISVPAAGLRAQGVSVQVVHPAVSDLSNRLGASSHVVLSRVPMSLQLAAALNVAREANPRLAVAYDIDDPLFDERLGEAQARLHLASLHASDVVLGSTPSLHDQATDMLGRKAGNPFPNGVHPKVEALSRRALMMPRRPGPPRLGFLSGSGTHQPHWEMIRDAVVSTMGEHGDVELWTIGPVDLHDEAESLAGRTCQVPFMDWTDLPFWLRQLDLIMMPNSDEAWLRETKSSIKWLEAALVKTPVIATATGPYSTAISGGRHGFLVTEGATDWEDRLKEALRSDLRQIGRKAHRHAIGKFGAETVALELIRGLQGAEPRSGAKLNPSDYPECEAEQPVTTDARRIKPRLPLRMQASILVRGARR